VVSVWLAGPFLFKESAKVELVSLALALCDALLKEY
jgi:nucleoside 2-deoxyribosyltransferase